MENKSEEKPYDINGDGFLDKLDVNMMEILIQRLQDCQIGEKLILK